MKIKIPTKCYACLCNLELDTAERDDNLKLYNCPQAHCSIWLNTRTRRVDAYILWIHRKGKRYQISASNTIDSLEGFTQLYLKSDYDSLQTLISIPRYKELYIKDDIVQGYELFEKMKTLLVFS